jgi:hypothetical protein
MLATVSSISNGTIRLSSKQAKEGLVGLDTSGAVLPSWLVRC